MAPTDASRLAVTCEEFLHALGGFSTILAVKLYRLRLPATPPMPVLPCLDHEAKLHEEVAPHVAAYIEDRGGHLHEVTYIPDERRIDVDAVSALGERSEESHQRMLEALRNRFPGHDVRTVNLSWLRGDQRVMTACRAQVTLRDVLCGNDLDRIQAAVERLQTSSALMEKESRVASWGARTAMTPLLAVVGFLSFQILASLDLPPQYAWVAGLRYLVVGAIGAYFLYYGLKAVQLTEMANRVWKRSAEYGLILRERRRLGRTDAPPVS